MYGGGIKYARSFHVKYTQIINRLFKVINRVALHSKSIQICHPDTKNTIKFDAPLHIEFIERTLETSQSDISPLKPDC